MTRRDALTATPAARATFSGWGGSCSGSRPAPCRWPRRGPSGRHSRPARAGATSCCFLSSSRATARSARAGSPAATARLGVQRRSADELARDADRDTGGRRVASPAGRGLHGQSADLHCDEHREVGQRELHRRRRRGSRDHRQGKGTVSAPAGVRGTASTKTCIQKYTAGRGDADRERRDREHLPAGRRLRGSARAHLLSLSVSGSPRVVPPREHRRRWRHEGDARPRPAAVVTHTSAGYQVTLQFSSSRAGVAHRRASRGPRRRRVTFRIAAGPARVGPLPSAARPCTPSGASAPRCSGGSVPRALRRSGDRTAVRLIRRAPTVTLG